jgi:glycine cleavage system transcriptional repressor
LKTYRILFLVGKDRPGIVHDVSTLLFEQGANIEDSRMATMGGCFSIMTLFSCAPERLDAVKTSLGALDKMGFQTSIYEAEDPGKGAARAELPLNVGVTAMDHPGIVQKVVQILRRHNVNIRSLNTEVSRAPLSGAPIFNLSIEAGIPAEEPIATLKTELSKLASEMNLDLDFSK